MTKQESFKRAVRARMAKTGEKYGAARRAMLQSPDPASQKWLGEPETSEAAVQANTGKSWDQWCQLIDTWPERSQGHTAMAAKLGAEYLESKWWAQTVIVGYERIRGLRTKYMRADGTFAFSMRRTIDADPDRLRARLLDVDAHKFTNPTFDPAEPLKIELRSKPTSKGIKWALLPDQGNAIFSISPKINETLTNETLTNETLRVSIEHESLGSSEAVEAWKTFWSEWLEKL